MKQEAISLSDQIRRRRLALGLSLSEVARRAGTSSATLSRYEHGWSRFEIYTLRKLAAALDCDLRVELSPKPVPDDTTPTARQTVSKIRRLFWDHPLKTKDLTAHTVWAVERVLEYGTIEDIRVMRGFLGKTAFLQTVAAAGRLSPRTRDFWRHILESEGIPCTKAFCRDTAWNS